jgi:NTE family protein
MKKLGVALSGGAARTIAHVGVLKALHDAKIPVSAVSGTSGGAVVAALYGAGLGVDDLIGMALRLKWRDFARFSINSLGLLSTQPIRELMETRIGNIAFEQMKIPCAVIATELTTFRAKVFRSGPVIPAVQASCSIPHVYKPMEWDGSIYTDGGVTNFLPVECLPYLGADVTLGVSTMRGRPRGMRPKHMVHLMALFSRFVQYNNFVRSRERADLLIQPSLYKFPVYRLHNARALLEEGEKAARAVLPHLRRLLEGDPADTAFEETATATDPEHG